MRKFLLTNQFQLKTRPSRKFQTLYATKFLALESQLLLYRDQHGYIETGFMLSILLEVTLFTKGSDHAIFKNNILSILSRVFIFYKLVDSLVWELNKSVLLRELLEIPIIQNLAIGEFQDSRQLFYLMKHTIEDQTNYDNSSRQELIMQFNTIMSKNIIDVRLDYIGHLLSNINNTTTPLTPDDLSIIQMIITFLDTMHFEKNGNNILVKLIEFNDHWASEVTMHKVATPSGAQISAQILADQRAELERALEAQLENYFESQGVEDDVLPSDKS
jgi:hypothetical protein